MLDDIYMLDDTSLEEDPNFFLRYAVSQVTSSNAAYASETGTLIRNFLTSRIGVALLMGAILSAPSRPPIVAAEPFIATLAGEGAFTDEMKKYTGRLLRLIVERLGGRWVRRGVKVTVPSRYGTGSIYTFAPGLSIELRT